MIFSKQSPLTSANLVNGETDWYYSGSLAYKMLVDFVTSFHYAVFVLTLFAIPFSSGKFSYAEEINYHPAWVKNDGSGLATVGDLVVPRIK